MAEQKTEDSKSPLARRAVRPFVGPPGGVPAAGPLVRPTGPASRPNPAPFAPPIAARRAAALGAAPNVEAPDPAVAPLRPSTPARSFDLTVAAPTTALPSGEALPASEAFVANDSVPVPHSFAMDEVYTPVDADVVARMAPVEPELVQPVPVEPSPRRPVTSEMVAIDAFEAFDAVWGSSNTPEASPIVSATTSPVDTESLGSALDGPNPWTDEMTVAPEAAPSGERLDAGSADSGGDVVDNPWLGAVTPGSALPAWLLDEPAAIEPASTFAEDPLGAVARAEPELVVAGAPSAGEHIAEAPIIADEAETATASYELFGSEGPAVATARVSPVFRVSAALERLAERVRAGEIDVSSVAPEAPDAAMLASLLAALLGGSSSR